MQQNIVKITKCIPFVSFSQKWNITCSITIKAKTKQEINRMKEEKEAKKLMRLLPHLPKKKQRIVESFLKTRWHNFNLVGAQNKKTDIQSIEDNSGKTSTSLVQVADEKLKVKLITFQRLKETKVNPEILKYIQSHNLGMIKKSKDRYPPSPVSLPEEVSQFFNPKFFRFRYGVNNAKSFPPKTIPEIGFAGRSNVGKSKLINALVGTGVVRSSPKPGLTKTINFFHLRGRLAFVDFPGYGFAYAQQDRVSSWNDLVLLLREVHILDKTFFSNARVGLKPSDIEFMRMLDKSKVRYRIVLTKVDKVPAEELAKRYQLISQDLKDLRFKLLDDEISMVSVYTKGGLNELRKFIYPFALPPKADKEKE